MNLVLSKRKVLASACLLAGLLAFLSVSAGRKLLPQPSPDHGRSGASILSTRCLMEA